MNEIDLTKKPLKRGELSTWYAAALAAQSSSGLSILAYAKKLGVSAPTLYLWKRRLSARANAKSETPKPGLVELVLERDRGDSTSPFVVRLGEDRSLEVSPGFDDTELRRLMQVLESC